MVKKFAPSTGIAAAVCLVLASCYPLEDPQQRNKATQATQKPTAEQTRLKQEEERKKQEAQRRQQAETTQPGTPDTTARQTPPRETTPPPTEPRRTDYPVANKVPGKDGFVFSPYNNKVVDVRDIPTGTLVQDPTYPASEKKYFRVP